METCKVTTSTSVPRSLNGVTPARSRLDVPKTMPPLECKVRSRAHSRTQLKMCSHRKSDGTERPTGETRCERLPVLTVSPALPVLAQLLCAELDANVFSEGVSSSMGGKTKGVSQLNRRGHSSAEQWIPLLWAAKNNNVLVAQSLIDERGNDVNKQEPMQDRSGSGSGAIHLAAQKGHVEMVELLLAKGAHKSLKDKHGNTAQALAEKKGYKEICAILEAAKDLGNHGNSWQQQSSSHAVRANDAPAAARKSRESKEAGRKRGEDSSGGKNSGPPPPDEPPPPPPPPPPPLPAPPAKAPPAEVVRTKSSGGRPPPKPHLKMKWAEQ